MLLLRIEAAEDIKYHCGSVILHLFGYLGLIFGPIANKPGFSEETVGGNLKVP